MSFANPLSPSKWFVFTGIFLRWLSVYLFLTNILEEYVSFIPGGISTFSLSALMLTALAIANTIVEIAWTHFNKKKDINYSKTNDLNYLVLRYFLAFIFFSYGIAKIIDEQFGSPYQVLDRRMNEVGPFSLAWRFFDYSYPYKLFIGLGQVIASALFLFRRTTSLAAIILLPIISNIVFVNFAFRVPVTYYSFCYLIFTIYLLICDFDRLYAVFISNVGFPANPILEISRYQFFSTRSFKIIRTIFVIAIIVWPLSDYFTVMSMDHQPNYAWRGSYKVSDFMLGKNSACPDSVAWGKVFVERWEGRGAARLANEKWAHFSNIRFDEKNKELKISFWDSANFQPVFAKYERINEDSLRVIGLWGKDSVQMTMKRYLK